MNSSLEFSRTLKLLHMQGSPREAKAQDHNLTKQNDIIPKPQLRKEDPREGAGRFRRRRWTSALSLTTMRSFMVRRRWESILLPVLRDGGQRRRAQDSSISELHDNNEEPHGREKAHRARSRSQRSSSRHSYRRHAYEGSTSSDDADEERNFKRRW